MQNKGLVKFFAILFALVSIYQLSFTFVANGVKEDAKNFSKGNPAKEVKYLDSIGKEDVYNLGIIKFTYNEVKDKQINKGLDLEGGINVILQISVKEVLIQLSNNSKNPAFNKALEDATKNQKGNQSYLDAFFEAFDANKGTNKLASPDIFANRNLQGQIDFNMTDDQVKKVLVKKVDESVESAFGVLRSRIDKFGVTQPNIVKLGQTGRILIESPGLVAAAFSFVGLTVAFKASFACCKKPIISSALYVSQNSNSALLETNFLIRSTSFAPGNSIRILPVCPSLAMFGCVTPNLSIRLLNTPKADSTDSSTFLTKTFFTSESVMLKSICP